MRIRERVGSGRGSGSSSGAGEEQEKEKDREAVGVSQLPAMKDKLNGGQLQLVRIWGLKMGELASNQHLLKG